MNSQFMSMTRLCVCSLCVVGYYAACLTLLYL